MDRLGFWSSVSPREKRREGRMDESMDGRDRVRMNADGERKSVRESKRRELMEEGQRG